MKFRHDGIDIGCVGDLRGIFLWAYNEEVVAEEVIDVGVDDSLLGRNLLGNFRVCYTYVGVTGLEVFDSVSCVAEDPADTERLGAVLDAFGDEGVGKLYTSMSLNF